MTMTCFIFLVILVWISSFAHNAFPIVSLERISRSMSFLRSPCDERYCANACASVMPDLPLERRPPPTMRLQNRFFCHNAIARSALCSAFFGRSPEDNIPAGSRTPMHFMHLFCMNLYKELSQQIKGAPQNKMTILV